MKNDYPDIHRQPPSGVKLDSNVYVTMRDGVKIAVDVYRPAKEGKYPAIFSTSAYIKDIQPCAPQLSHSIEAGNPFYLAQNGYIHIIGQSRGSGMSQGQYNWYDAAEQKDGYDMIEWIARQPWCTGNVGMLGDSYFGRIQWLIAGEQPPHLKTIVPFDASSDDYRSRHEGGLIRLGFLSGWGADTMLQCLWPGPVEGKLPPTNLFEAMFNNPDDGPFWWERSGYKKFDKIKIPVLSMVVGGSRLHSRTQLSGYNKLNTTKKMVIFPFFGFNANAVLALSKPLNDYLLRWFDHWLKGIDNGIMNDPEISICDRATKEWQAENEYPLARTKWTKYYLHFNPAGTSKTPMGLINTIAPIKEEPYSFSLPEGMELVYRGNPLLSYSTPPMTEDLKIWGPLSITLYGSSTSRDTAWFVKTNDIGPDGQATLLTSGILKASYREVDPAKSAPGQPYHSYQKPVLPEPNKIYEYQIEITPMFWTFKKGHQLRVDITNYDVQFMAEHNTVFTSEQLPTPAKNTIYHDAQHPTHLLLPIIPEAPATKAVNPLITQVKWPLGDTGLPL